MADDQDFRALLRENIALGTPNGVLVAEGEQQAVVCGEPHRPRIHLIRDRGSLEVAERLVKEGHNVCVLNFANNEVPGGGLGLRGNTQEEQLMKRTTLGASLRQELYPLDEVENQYVRWQYHRLRLIYSASVRLVRDEALTPITDGVEFAVISCAAIKTPRTRDGRYLSEDDRAVTRRKIAMIIDTAIQRGHKILIAGQWGCGVFLNPLEMCELWVEIAKTRDITLVFPVFDQAFQNKMEECLAHN